MSKKIRLNITVDKEIFEEAKSKLTMFGGKISTLFNIYLKDFVESASNSPAKTHEELNKKIKDLEARMKKLESKNEK